jgi:lysophospholipase L1-like esterase
MPRFSATDRSRLPAAAVRAAIRVVLPVVLTLAPVFTASAQSKIGLIGDSMMVATNSDQMCGKGGEVLQCFENKLGNHDFAFSHGAGDFPWSIARRLGYGDGEILNAADDGEEWKDALEQAQVITSDPDVNTVFIQLGANDVCADYGHDFAGDLAETAAEIDATLSHLVNSLPEGATIYWSGVVDVVGFRNALVDRRHNFAFKTCQGLWDLDPDNLSDEAVRSLCKDLGIPNYACDGLTEFDAIREPLLEELIGFFIDAYNVETPCGAVLDGRNSEADLERAREFNIALNQLLEAKAQAWSESQDRVDIVFTNNLFNLEIPPYFVSRLDCFHPNRAGQMNLAEEIWKGFEPLQAGNVSFFVDEFDNHDWCIQEWTTWDSCWYDYGDPGFTIGVDGRNRFEIAKETSNNRQHFVARDLGDLSDKTFAWMSFNHKRQHLDDGGDRVTLAVHADGFWYDLDVFKGGGNDRNAHPGEYYDLTPYLSSDVRIEFRTSNQKSMKDGDSVRLDNFNIFAWGPTPVPEPALGATGSGLVVMVFAAMAARRGGRGVGA